MKKPRTQNLHDFGIFGRVHDSQNQVRIFIFGDTRTLQRIQEQIQKHFRKLLFAEVSNIWNSQIWKMERRTPDNPDDPSNK